MEIPVTLIVKNQENSDQTIKCELSWSIKKLKGYLSENYPCKPSTDEQKLIYSGQLLHDAVILKDILRQYDEQIEEGHQIHTVHLVFTPKIKPNTIYNKSGGTSGSVRGLTDSTDGLRQRNLSTNRNNEPVINQPTSIYTNIPGQQQQQATMNCGINPNPFNQQQTNEYIIAQQLAMQQWMQHAYSQYLNQYVNLISMGVRPESIYLPQTVGSPQNNIPNNPFYSPQNLDNSIISPLLNNQQLIQQQQQLQQQIQQQQQQNDPQPLVMDQQPQQELQNRPQGRFPNIVQEEVQENRDWLDMFYALSRLAIFLTLVYFYSSPLRCLVVLFVGISIYLYHIGFFRTNLPEANNNLRPIILQNNNNNNNINNNNNVVAPQLQQQQQPIINNHVVEENLAEPVVENQPPQNQSNNVDTVDESQQLINNNNINNELEVDATDNVNPTPPATDSTISTNESTSEITVQNETRLSFISFMRTFFISFFSSLIPDHAL